MHRLPVVSSRPPWGGANNRVKRSLGTWKSIQGGEPLGASIKIALFELEDWEKVDLNNGLFEPELRSWSGHHARLVGARGAVPLPRQSHHLIPPASLSNQLWFNGVGPNSGSHLRNSG
jgi:hypothetical protein